MESQKVHQLAYLENPGGIFEGEVTLEVTQTNYVGSRIDDHSQWGTAKYDPIRQQ